MVITWSGSVGCPIYPILSIYPAQFLCLFHLRNLIKTAFYFPFLTLFLPEHILCKGGNICHFRVFNSWTNMVRWFHKWLIWFPYSDREFSEVICAAGLDLRYKFALSSCRFKLVVAGSFWASSTSTWEFRMGWNVAGSIHVGVRTSKMLLVPSTLA